jgi:hypothetical protein
MQLYVRASFALLLLIYTILLKWAIGVPIKDVILVGLSCLLLLIYNRQCIDFLKRHTGIYLLLLVLAALGIPLTLVNEPDLGVVGRELLGYIIQPCLIMLCTYVLAVVAGVRFTAGTFVVLTLFSGAFVLLQFAGLDAAWSARHALSALQPEPEHIKELVTEQNRPLGLSYSAIMYSYQLISAYVIGNILYRHGLMRPRTYFIFVVAVVLISVANGTRSLLIGIAVQELLQNAPRLKLKSILALAVVAAVGYVAFEYLEVIGSRVTSVSDASAVGRTMLYRYGFRLAADYPFGIGWGFEPSNLAWLYWDFLSELARADAAFRLELHNAYLNFYMNYGLFGVLAILAAFYLKPRFFLQVLFYFSAYLAHAFFHNDGFFLSDDFNWFAFGILMFMQDRHLARTETISGHQPAITPRVAEPEAMPARV